jgi:Fe2+ or Zn2+ uptake regulation protein
MKSVAELTELFRAQGLKVTPQRQAIFRVVHDATDHPTAETVYESVSADMPTISLRTVYQTLNDLASMGELRALDLGTGSTRFDPMAEPHHHIVCTRCGAVRDLIVDFPDVAVPSRQLGGFAVGEAEITWRGLCPSCQPAKSNNQSVKTGTEQE